MEKGDWYKPSLEFIDNVLKGYFGDCYSKDECRMWYYCLKLLGSHNYNNLVNKSDTFNQFCDFLKNEDLSLDIFRVPLVETKITSINSNNPDSYTEQITFRRNVETDESHKVKELIWGITQISEFPKQMWDVITK